MGYPYRENIIKMVAQSFLNTPYIWGGDDPSGVDCSGLVQEILAAIGLDPKGDQTAQMLFDHFKEKECSYISLGCLLFFGKSKSEISHVTMAMDLEHMIEAGGGGRKTLTQQDAVAQNAFVRIRPFSNRSDLVAIVNPLS